MSNADFPQLLKRLEAVTTRLEDLSSKGSGGAGHAVGAANGSAAPAAAGGPSLEGYDELLNGPLAKFVQLSGKVGGVVQEQAALVKKVFDEQKRLLVIATQHKKPDMATLQLLLKPATEIMGKIADIKEKNRASPLFNHLSTVAEGVPALGWPAIEPKPAPHVGEMKEAAQFYANRIVKEWKERDKSHVEWASSFTGLLVDLQGWVKKFHTTGLVWSPNGSDPKNAVGGGGGSAPAAASPAVGVAAAAPAKPAVSGAGLFSELNKGGNITSGLKKVEKSEMTHKNPALRASSVVKAEEKAPAPGVQTSSAQAKRGPPKLALEGNKWFVENHDNNKGIVLDQVDMKQGAYIFGCDNCTIQIKGKIGAVVIDSCRKTAVVVEHVISSLDVVNSKSIQLQILGRAPTAVIDKTDGLNLFLSKDCLDIEIFTAKSSELNLSIPPPKDGDDFIERPLPEQMKTVVTNRQAVTTIVEHKG